VSTGYNRDRRPSEPPSLQELLDCLGTYPEGTQGHLDETSLLTSIHSLCMNHGFGRVSQIAKAVEAIWLKNEDAGHAIRFYADHRRLMHELAKRHADGDLP
jgi:hypothetical protein